MKIFFQKQPRDLKVTELKSKFFNSSRKNIRQKNFENKVQNRKKTLHDSYSIIDYYYE